MDKNLYDFLTKLKVSENCYQLCKDGVLKETTYNPNSKTFTIHIHFNAMVKPELYHAINEIKSKIKLETNFDLTYSFPNFDLSYIKSIFTKKFTFC